MEIVIAVIVGWVVIGVVSVMAGISNGSLANASGRELLVSVFVPRWVIGRWRMRGAPRHEGVSLETLRRLAEEAPERRSPPSRED